ncbi:MAG: sensor histidine kinase [Bacteroidales bacterium]|nr:sensor histidine kinase [Bacteroidales bacterium]MCF8402917.1 sensor histidine kinase [Bacteroidales bacterium]
MRIFLLLFFILFTMILTGQQSKLDSLENLLPGLSGADKVNMLNELCWLYGTIDIQKAEEFGLSALALSKEIGDSLLIAQVYNDLGTVYFRKSDYDSALSLFIDSRRIREKEDKAELIAASDNKIGAVYQEQGKFDLAVKHQLLSIAYYERNYDSIHMSQGYTNLARVYYENHEIDKAIEYNNKALEIFKRYNYTYGLATTYGSLALCYQEIKQDSLAIDNLIKSLNLFVEVEDNFNIATVLLNLGQLYRKRGDLKNGISYYLQAIDLTNKTGDLHTQAVASANLANIYTETGEYKEAERLYKQALAIAIDSDIIQLEHQCYRGMAGLYAQLGKFGLAYQYKIKQYDTRDSIYNIEKYKQFSELQTKYDTEKKEQQIEILSIQDEVNQLKLRRQRAIILAAIGGIIIVILFSTLLIGRKHLQQKARLEAEKNKYRKKLLDASIEVEENERKRIARELHDGVAQQLGGLKLSWQAIMKEVEGETAEKLNEITQTLDQAADEVRNISHQMMPKTLSTNGLILAIEDLLAKSLKYSDIEYRFENFKAEGRFNEKIELSIYRICQELINNVVKHSGAKFVSVQLLRNNNNLVLILEDNGKGFKPEEKRDGIGLLNIASRIDTVNGEINYEPSPGSGTVATVRVPLA